MTSGDSCCQLLTRIVLGTRKLERLGTLRPLGSKATTCEVDYEAASHVRWITNPPAHRLHCCPACGEATRTFGLRYSNTESAFLKSYTPKPAVASYKIEANGGWSSDGKTAGAGEGYAHHQRDFHEEIAIPSNDLAPLANALNNDVREQLVHSGAKILGGSGGGEHGFRYSYKSGNSLGEVIIAPPHISNSEFTIGNGYLRVAIDIYLDEKWFPPKKG
jgi:hypothetical protein